MQHILDTNILVRYFVNDNLTLHKKAIQILKSKNKFVVPFFVLLELNYVLLGSIYNFEKYKVLEALEFIIKNDKFVVPKNFVNALEIYKRSNLSLADSYLMAISQNATLYTFDKKIISECKKLKIKTY